MEKVIQTRGLTKEYNGLVAVDHLDLEINRGEVYGLLGPNGSGKTTTILMLLGLTEPTSGEVTVLDVDPSRRPLEVKSRVGYLPDQVGFYDEMTGRDNLRYTADLNRIPVEEAEERIERYLVDVGLPEAGDRPVGEYSHGMRQRLGLADVLLKEPELVILDEPTLGLDPEAARQFLVRIEDLKSRGITVMLASHLLHQVQAVCDRVGLFHQGRKSLEGSVYDLAQRVLEGAYRIHLQARGDGLEGALESISGVVGVSREGDAGFVIEAQEDLRPQVVEAVVGAGGEVLRLSLEEPGLDEVYAHHFDQEVIDATA
ncbi:MAG: ABC transporter ATP-binding protein [Anaerolineales bacterium]|nr:ABC transporter ATP-binding protein [Anaerolineales bacterium]